MQDQLEQAASTGSLSPVESPPQARSTRGGTCLLLILAILIAVVCAIAGGVLYSYFPSWGWSFSSSAQPAVILEREKICELSFFQETVLLDTKSEFPWSFNIPMQLGSIEAGKGEIKVKGIYLIKYGIDAESISLWEYFPDTRELQISKPSVKVTSIQTIFQELDGESETKIKSIFNPLGESERNLALKKNRDEAGIKAQEAIQHNLELERACFEQLRTLLSSFGISLVIIEPLPTLN